MLYLSLSGDEEPDPDDVPSGQIDAGTDPPIGSTQSHRLLATAVRNLSVVSALSSTWVSGRPAQIWNSGSVSTHWAHEVVECEVDPLTPRHRYDPRMQLTVT